ncbi:hypothetical protein V7138_15060 [Bacillus sp. JJ1533]|uniref:hypothetical protein n=1 Tax=Bacillus sp. JJ1533 TaxID=3122959 RepID=UPI002FFE2D7F
MTRNEINQLYMDKRRKGLSNKKIAQAIGCSPSLISQFFNFQCGLSSEKEMKLRQIIDTAKEYRTVTIPID